MPGTPAPNEGIEARTQELGRALLDAAEDYRPGPAERIEDWLLTTAVADERFRSRLLRYMDVLASLDFDASGAEAKRLAQEYFGTTDFPGLPRGLRWLLRIARDEHLPARLVGESARRSAEVFARRFITPPGEESIREAIAYLGEHGRTPSFDLLGEAVLSESEARAYLETYLGLIERLSHDPAAGQRTAGDIPALQISLKLSSLTSHFSPVDPAGTVKRVRGPLEAIGSAAREAGIGLAVDLEQYTYRDLTWDAFRAVFAHGEPLGDWPDAGIVLQGYLRDAEAHAEDIVAFGHERAAPFQVRLVKGAYWDYEVITAAANRWPAPVHTDKAATDAQFERLTARLIEAHPHLRLAVASHNARAHAVAEALREAAGLPPGAVEHQTLYRTAEGMSRAIARLGWPSRDYVPVGELLPGMAYLVRRVLENSSQAGFLLQSRSGATVEELLRPPPRREPPDAGPPAEVGGFPREPAAEWHDEAFRQRFERALEETRERWGERYRLRAGPDLLPAEEMLDIFSPSHPSGPPMGHVDFAGPEALERAITTARGGQPAWAATPVEERARILRVAAELLRERSAEFAAWCVHGGGRDRADAYAEVEEAIDYLEYYSTQAESLFGSFGDRIEPQGVVAVIPPWNFLLAIPCGMTVAALAAGNAVILKPAEQTPLIALRLVALLYEAGVPQDALIYLAGRGETIGQALVEDQRVSMVAFTGSRAVGTWMHQAVAGVALEDGGMKALVAEMGGKNPILVFADADLDEAVAGIVRSAFGHANQKCSAASRVLVERPIFERLRDRLIEATRSLRVGPADDPATEMNPVINAEARDRLREVVNTVRSEGRVLLDLFDEPSAGDPASLQLGPLLVEIPAKRHASATTTTEELFGPVLALTPFDDEEEAYRLANATAYGLTAGIYSRSPRTIERAARAVEAGNIYVNRPTTGARVGIEPFGGMKHSGTGPKAGGPDYLWAFVRRADVPGTEPSPSTHEHVVDVDAALEGLASCWATSLAERVEAIEGAAVLLGGEGRGSDAATLLAAAQAARRELGVPAPTLQVPGQSTELRYDMPRGLGVVCVEGEGGVAWLAATLLAGNAAAAIRTPSVEAAVAALHRAGVPAEVLRLLEVDCEGGAAVSSLARDVRVEFVATDSAATARAAYRVMGATPEGARSLKALFSPLDGPQPGEPGFLRRFAWPRVIAVRTLRHGADLAFEAEPGR